MANKFIRDLNPWPANVPISATANLMLYSPELDEEFRFTPEQLTGLSSGSQPGANDTYATTKVVRYLNSTSVASFDPATDSAVDTLLPEFLCLETTARIIDPQPGEPSQVILKYTPSGGSAATFDVWRDGRFARTGVKSSAAWYDVASLAATRAQFRAITAGTTNFALDEVGIYTLSGAEGFYQYKAPAGGTYGVPTGADDANWHQVAPPLPAAATAVTISLATARLIQAEDAGRPGVRYTIVRPGGNVSLGYVPRDEAGDIAGGFEPTGHWQQPVGPILFVTYDVTSDTPVAFAGGGGTSYPYMGVFPATGTVNVKQNQLYRNATTNLPYRAKSDFTASAQPVAGAYWELWPFVVREELSTLLSRFRATNSAKAEYVGADFSAAVTFAGNFGRIELNGPVDLSGNVTLGEGTTLYGKMNYFRLNGFSVTMRRSSIVKEIYPLPGTATGGAFIAAGDNEIAATSATPVLDHCLFFHPNTVRVPAGKGLYIESPVLGGGVGGTSWAEGAGFIQIAGTYPEGGRPHDLVDLRLPATGGASVNEAQIRSVTGVRVAIIDLNYPLTLLSAVALSANNAASITYQVAKYSGSAWAGQGERTSIADVAPDLVAVTGAERAAGARLEIKTIPITTADVARISVSFNHG